MIPAGRPDPRAVADKIAPVQGYSAGIPWSLHLRAWDAYAKRYGRQQSADRMAERGGFGCGELDMFVPGWRDEVSEIGQLKAALAAAESRAAEAVAGREAAERRVVPLVQALLAAAPHHQGAHGVIGEAIASALGIPHPIRVPDLITLVETLGIEPPDVWPWEPKHALARALRREPRS